MSSSGVPPKRPQWPPAPRPGSCRTRRALPVASLALAAPRAAGLPGRPLASPFQLSAPRTPAASPGATPATPSSPTSDAAATRISPPAHVRASALPPPSPDRTQVTTPAPNPYVPPRNLGFADQKSTRLNSSHQIISY